MGQMGVNRRVCSQKRMICDLSIRKYNIRRTRRVKISKTIITTKLILCMRYSTHSKVFGKIKLVQNDLQTFYAIKFQCPKTTNLSLNLGCETSSTLLPNYSFEHATHRAVMLYESCDRALPF